MKLKRIIDSLSGIVKLEGKANIEISGIACDSKLVKQGYLFAALKGSSFNGADFINEAIDRGAHAILLDSDNEGIFKKGYTYIYAKDARIGLSEACRAYFGDISSKMHLVGVTGTNGKTTITYLIESLFKARNQECGVIGTINYRFGRRLIPAINTTPGILELYSLLSLMQKEKINNCIMEVSSHSLEQLRVETLRFDAAIFTNLTREHLDFHKNMDSYLKAKLKLFSKIKENGFAVINIDDPVSGKIIEKLKAETKANISTYAIDREADIMAKDISLSCSGLKFSIGPINNRPLQINVGAEYYSAQDMRVESSLIGRHNIYNILASIGAGVALGMNLEDIKRGIESLKGLAGRLELISCGQNFSVYVDYAHTEDGLENVLKSLRELKPRTLISVFGCGGSRDRSKRPVMGKIASKFSDMVFITSDNPRNEEPMDIINEIIKGIDTQKNNYIIEPDRFNAIKKALRAAREGDIVLIAGKGHETYQIFKDTTLPFDDRDVVKKILLKQFEITKIQDTITKQ